MQTKSGIVELDNVLGGGFKKGTLSLVVGEGEAPEKTEALIQLAERTARSGSKVVFTSFDDGVEMLRQNEITSFSNVITFKNSQFDTLQAELASVFNKADIIFVDSLNKLDFFSFNPEAFSVIHNLTLLSKMWNVPVVASMGVFVEHDVVALLRKVHAAFAVSEVNGSLALEVIKNDQDFTPNLITLNCPRLVSLGS